MNRKLRVIQLIVMLLFSIVLFIFVAFAWFASVSKTEPIIIETGSLKVECKFYRGFDDDGELEFVEITEAHLVFEKALPGNIYTFKLTVTNIGSVAGNLSIIANGIEASNPGVLDYFYIEFTEPEEETIYLSEDDNGSLLLFEDYFLESNTSFDFLFTIHIDGNTSGNDLKEQSLSIENFIVNLVQDHN